jgi:DNA-directed RNA polymerase specialized sigma24 family protein
MGVTVMGDPETTSGDSERLAKQVWFDATSWTTVREAGQPGSPEADAARAKLCQAYWYPLYFYVRRLGQSPEDAQDLTQGFFARLLEKNYVASADREKGRFRSFLLVLLKRFLAGEWARANRQKRGGGVELIPLDLEHTESRYVAEPADELSPDKAFDRRWAQVLLARVTDRLQAQCVAEGKGHLFAELRPFLTGEGEEPYEAVAQRLQIPKATLKVLVHRFRQRYGQVLREEIAPTVASPEEVEDELRALFAALS